MKRKVQRILSSILAAVLVTGNIPVYAADVPEEPVLSVETEEADGVTVTEGDYELTVIDEDAKTASISKYKGTGSGSLTIPATLGDYSIVELGDNSYKGSGFTSVTIPATILKVGSYAFSNCGELQSVVFAEGTSAIDMDHHTFYECDKLQSIKLSERVTAIPSTFAYGCELLTTVEWPAALATIGATAFCNDKMLTSSDLSGTSLTTIGDGAFSGCTALPVVKFPTETTALKIDDNAFKGTAMSGEGLIIPANVASLGSYAFANCDELQRVEVAEGTSAIDMDHHTFYECDKLQSIKLSERVTAIPSTFAYGCELLTTVEWPAALATIGATAFCNDKMLTSSDLSGTSLTTIGDGAFSGCTALPVVKFPTETTALKIDDNAFKGTAMSGEGLVIPANVASLGSYAFANCDELQRVEIAEGSTTLSMDHHTFYECDKLQSIKLSERVTSIPSTFAYGCELLTTVEWPAALATIGATAFCNDKMLTSSDLSGTSLTTIGDGAFSGCTALPVVKFPTETTALTIDDNAFKGAGMSGEDALIIPANVASLGSYAFANCDELQRVEIAEGSTTLSMDHHTFYDCDSLQKISLSSRVTVIPDTFAYGCPNLIQLVSGNAVVQMPSSGAFNVSTKAEIVLTDCNQKVKDYNWSGDSRVVVSTAVSVLLEERYTVEEGQTLDLRPVYTLVPENGTMPELKWTSSSDSYATVTDGKVKGKKKGECTVTVETAQGIKKGSCKITVVEKGAGPAPAPEPFVAVPGGEGAVDPQPYLVEETTELTLVKGQKFVVANKGWKSDTKSVVGVSKKNMSAKKAGTATLRYGEMSVTATVLAPAHPKSEKNVKLDAGTEAQLTLGGATPSGNMIRLPGASDDLQIRFYTANPDVATVEDDGTVTGVAAGKTTVTAYVNGVAFKYTVKVSEPEPVKYRTLHVNVNKSKSIKIKGLRKTAWTLSENAPALEAESGDVVTVTAKGKVTGKIAGEADLICEEGYTVHVIVDDPRIAENNNKYKASYTLHPEEGRDLGLNYVHGSPFFKSNKNSIAYVDADGMIHARTKGKAKITGKVNGKAVTITVKVE